MLFVTPLRQYNRCVRVVGRIYSPPICDGSGSGSGSDSGSGSGRGGGRFAEEVVWSSFFFVS